MRLRYVYRFADRGQNSAQITFRNITEGACRKAGRIATAVANGSAPDIELPSSSERPTMGSALTVLSKGNHAKLWGLKSHP